MPQQNISLGIFCWVIKSTNQARRKEMEKLFCSIMNVADAAVAVAYPADINIHQDSFGLVVANAASEAAIAADEIFNYSIEDAVFNAAIYLITILSRNNKKRIDQIKDVVRKL
ncbi:MAG: hypothetical protein ACFFDH_13535 [Promethearchaeota archaeon]